MGSALSQHANQPDFYPRLWFARGFLIGVGLAAGFAVPLPLAVAEPVLFAPPVVPLDEAPLPAPPLEDPPVAGVDDGVLGSEVSGVGTSGIGFVKIPAIISLSPAADFMRSV